MQRPQRRDPTRHSRRRVLRATAAAALGAVAGCADAGSTPGRTGRSSPRTGPLTTPGTAGPDADESSSDETPTDDSLAARIADHAVALDTVAPSAGVGPLEPLADAVADEAVVGLGESVHGSRALFRLKHRLLRLLVTRLDLGAVALEANFSETLAVNDYVLFGRGDPAAALGGLHYWMWDTREVLAVVEWLRAYNAGRPRDERVAFHGVDANYSTGPARALRDYLRTVDPAYLDGVRDTLAMLVAEGLQVDDRAVLTRRIDATERLLAALDERLRERRGGYVAATSRRAWRLARQHRRVLAQHLEAARGRVDDDVSHYYGVRDRSMAENTQWVREFVGGDRVALWAHNAHVKAGTNYGGAVDSTGKHLRAALGDRYYALGLEFGRGSVLTLPDVTAGETEVATLGAPPRGSVPATLAGVADPALVLEFDAPTGDDRLDGWLADEHRLHDVGSLYVPGSAYERLAPSAAFDGVAFVDETGPSRPLPDEAASGDDGTAAQF